MPTQSDRKTLEAGTLVDAPAAATAMRSERFVAAAGRAATLPAVKNFKRLIILGALVAVFVVLARKIRET